MASSSENAHPGAQSVQRALFNHGERVFYAGAECVVTRQAKLPPARRGEGGEARTRHYWLRTSSGDLITAPWYSLVPVA